MSFVRVLVFASIVTALAVPASPARADEVGGSGFDVPSNQWLHGIEGLVRTPVDLSLTLGASWFWQRMHGAVRHNDDGVESATSVIHISPGAIEGGFRMAGGIGYWECCVMIEPAFAFWAWGPLYDHSGDGPLLRLMAEPDEVFTSNVEMDAGWDIGFGPQMTWMIDENTPVIGKRLGGLPLVFFPFAGISHVNYNIDLVRIEPGEGGLNQREIDDNLFMIGFDLDIPLPGSRGPFTQALTLGFKWLDAGDKHVLHEFFGDNDFTRYVFQDTHGPRFELRYTVTWNDFESFFKHNVFGPVN
jgi:hypothetical protein